MKFIFAIFLICIPLIACSCAKHSESQSPSVVLYTSTDDEFARLIARAFTDETGIVVKLVGDTEATKTTGLVARLKAESSNPSADVWWSSEPFGTIDLTNARVLQTGALDGIVSDDWPTALHDPDWSWLGFASRARVIAYASDRVESPPTTLRELAQQDWKGRIGMARPQFGTTRGHMGILASRWGLGEFERWVTQLKSNNIRLYDGNASVVRAIAMGEIDVGLTDTDDVWSGQRNGWKVDCVYEAFDPPMLTSTLASFGPTLLPNTVGIVSGAPNPEHAKRLARFLVSDRVETLLAESESRNLPASPALIDLYTSIAPQVANPDQNGPGIAQRFDDFSDALSMIPQALDICDRVLAP
ncbi:MAG: extracellular solute-binding protein [Phycisphaerales bacterium]